MYFYFLDDARRRRPARSRALTRAAPQRTARVTMKHAHPADSPHALAVNISAFTEHLRRAQGHVRAAWDLLITSATPEDYAAPEQDLLATISTALTELLPDEKRTEKPERNTARTANQNQQGFITLPGIFFTEGRSDR